jgi:pilus assembly protein CpaB
MKNRRALLMMALAVVFGLAAVVLASRWLLRQTPAPRTRSWWPRPMSAWASA